jgi:hypothetical protein
LDGDGAAVTMLAAIRSQGIKEGVSGTIGALPREADELTA